jgi:anti-anti-sigma factor
VRQPDAQQLRVDVSEACDVLVVTVRGSAGHRQAEHLADALARVTALSPRSVVLDVSRATFVSSLCAGVLTSFRHAVARRGARITSVHPSPGEHPPSANAKPRATG